MQMVDDWRSFELIKSTMLKLDWVAARTARANYTASQTGDQLNAVHPPPKGLGQVLAGPVSISPKLPHGHRCNLEI